MTDLFRAIAHIRLHRAKTFVIKAGGGPLSKPAQMRALARQIGVVQALGSRVVLVHGGGPQTDVYQRLLGEEPYLVDGRRVTTPIALRALRMATAGELSGELVAALTAEGAPAIGVSGASAGLLVARRRAPMQTSEGTVDFGEVGDLESVDPRPLTTLLDAGYVPVVCPPAGDGKGGFLNVNADLTAAAIAVALNAAKLVLVTGAPGVLADPDDPDSLFSSLCLADLDRLEASGAVRAGMKVKATAIRRALQGGVGRVHVVSGSDPEALVRELYTNHGAGTLITTLAQTAPDAEAVIEPATPPAATPANKSESRARPRTAAGAKGKAR
ncbi:MAG TPA: acetylglutamate kinase [Planctomycetota bacterium]|nr:acetylglutamate kinase [Planctomycetota bacterium]